MLRIYLFTRVSVYSICVWCSVALTGPHVCQNRTSGTTYCCIDYRAQNDKCVVCENGTRGHNCSKACDIGYFGRFCINKCECPKEMCDPKYGCRSPSTNVLDDTSLMKSTRWDGILISTVEYNTGQDATFVSTMGYVSNSTNVSRTRGFSKATIFTGVLVSILVVVLLLCGVFLVRILIRKRTVSNINVYETNRATELDYSHLMSSATSAPANTSHDSCEYEEISGSAMCSSKVSLPRICSSEMLDQAYLTVIPMDTVQCRI